MYSLLKQRRLHWLDHVCMKDGRIPKDLFYEELTQGIHSTGRLKLRLKDDCKRDLKALEVNVDMWEVAASDWSAWKQAMKGGLSNFEEVQGKEMKKKGLNPSKLTNDYIHLSWMWQRSPFPHRHDQLHQTMSSPLTSEPLVSQD